MKYTALTSAFLAWTIAGAQVLGQQAPTPPAPGGRAARPEAYPQRPPDDPAIVQRGRTIYSVQCSFCHGSDARGGENNGPNLLRSQLVLNDQRGELIAPVVQNGRPERGMPKFDIPPAQITDIAGYIHSFRVGGYDVSRMTPPSILVGDAKAGAAFFAATCGSCHSVTGDLAGIGTKVAEPKALQQTWLMPGRAGAGAGAVKVPPTTVTVTLANGTQINGRLGRLDDFLVTLTEADGTPRSFRRDGDSPKVDVHDPLRPHRDLLRTYSDKNIHDVTAYLVTVK
jgi:mono/diheme cytochrome c family protein